MLRSFPGCRSGGAPADNRGGDHDAGQVVVRDYRDRPLEYSHTDRRLRHRVRRHADIPGEIQDPLESVSQGRVGLKPKDPLRVGTSVEEVALDDLPAGNAVSRPVVAEFLQVGVVPIAENSSKLVQTGRQV